MKALVTGASRGIGRAIARLLHARGAELAVSARELSHLRGVLEETPGSVGLAAELTRADEVDTLVPRARAALGGLDAFVHCAGVVRYAPALELTRAELEEQLTVNFSAGFVLCQAAARVMTAAGSGGAMVCVASTLGMRPAQGSAAYAASKAALLSMVRAFALELAPAAIRVNAVAPGVIDTDMVHVVRGSDRDRLDARASEQRIAEQLAQLAALHPLGRLGKAEEVAEAVLYLLEARFVTGSVLVVDGGLTLA
ncbi:MAG TPA: SDR family oxidoreductase [Polyangiales bacterium]|nr:SDR family oxidoreductase [Polyangiales bacterium]